MSPLRRRMIEDLTIRNLSPATQRSYLHAVSRFSQTRASNSRTRFAVSPHATEDVMASGRSNEVSVFGPGFGNDTLVGFLAIGVRRDVVQLNASMFASGSTLSSILNSLTGTTSATITNLAG